jgi:hypothetical protein
MTSSARYYADPSAAEAFATLVLEKAGLPETDAGLMAKCLVQADVRGVVSHFILTLSNQSLVNKAFSGYSRPCQTRTIPQARYGQLSQQQSQIQNIRENSRNCTS